MKKALFVCCLILMTAAAFAQDYDQDIAEYTGAIRKNPNDAGAYSNRGVAYYDKGDFDKAIADYDEALRRNPDLADAYGNRGAVYAMKEDYPRARADWEQALRLNPNDASARKNLEVLRQMGH